MKTYELIGEVDERHELHLVVPQECAAGKVRVLVMEPESALSEQAIAPRKSMMQIMSEEQTHTNGSTVSGIKEPDLAEWIKQFAMDTGIEDLAHEHDHYIHGTPKRNDR